MQRRDHDLTKMLDPMDKLDTKKDWIYDRI